MALRRVADGIPGSWSGIRVRADGTTARRNAIFSRARVTPAGAGQMTRLCRSDVTDSPTIT